MLQVLKGTKPNVLSTKAIGEISKEDQDQLFSMLHKKLNEKNRMCWYLELEKFIGWKPGAEPENFGFNYANYPNLDKIAIVGARDWKDLLKQSLKSSSAEIKFFQSYQKQEAIQWVEK